MPSHPEPQAEARGDSCIKSPDRDRLRSDQAPRVRSFWLICGAILLLALLCRLAILAEFLDKNPIAHEPWLDAEVYWQTAGEIAAGRWTPDTPFLSAPLYPYFVAAIRSVGGELAAVYGVQIGMHLLTAVLIAHAGRRRFGDHAGLIAVGLFVLLDEPATASMRVLGTTLQLFLVALIWWRWSALAQADASRGRGWFAIAGVGLLIGLLALTYPAAMLLIPTFAAWVWWTERRRIAALGSAALAVVVAGSVIAVPTIHNWRASGDIILISAHGGITLRQGNGPKSQGVFTYVLDIDPDRRKMHQSAQLAFRKKHGRDGSWAEIDAHFRREVVAFWLHEPAAAALLISKKLFWFVASRNYDDIVPPPLEREAGLASRWWLAPLPTAWLLGTGVVGLIACLRSRRGGGAELALVVLPLLTVLVFFYSPRYRMPAVPILCGLSGLAIARPSRPALPRPLAAAIAATPVLLSFVIALDFDDVSRWRASYRAALLPALADMGDRQMSRGDAYEARATYERATAIDPSFARARTGLGRVAEYDGDVARAEREYRIALSIHPRDSATLRRLYNLLRITRQFAAAVDVLQDVARVETRLGIMRDEIPALIAACQDGCIRTANELIQYGQTSRMLFAAADHELTQHVIAAVNARAGRFADAISAAQAALAEARWSRDAARLAFAEARLADYRARRAPRAPFLKLTQ